MSAGGGCRPVIDPEEALRPSEDECRDSPALAQLYRAGELTAVWVPDERHGAMHDLARAPAA